MPDSGHATRHYVVLGFDSPYFFFKDYLEVVSPCFKPTRERNVELEPSNFLGGVTLFYWHERFPAAPWVSLPPWAMLVGLAFLYQGDAGEPHAGVPGAAYGEAVFEVGVVSVYLEPEILREAHGVWFERSVFGDEVFLDLCDGDKVVVGFGEVVLKEIG